MQIQRLPFTLQIFELILAFIAWFAIGIQALIASISLINLLSYFTIWSNLTVAVALTVPQVFPSSTAARYFLRPKVRSAIALYILIVGLVYNIVLRGIWDPKGWQLLADNLLHVVVPCLYVGYWVVSIPKKSLKWTDGKVWLCFPLLYVCYSMVRGHLIHWYPYPFLDVDRLRYPSVLFNIALMAGIFLIISTIMIWLNNKLIINKTLKS